MSECLIPKKIHYCWFGDGEKSPRIKRCIASWKKHCPDFEIIEWNESNYDITKHPFLERAIREKKWAFASDFARLDIIYNCGGIYLDTDVEVLKDLSPLCSHMAFMGFEEEDIVADGLGFGGVKWFPLFKEMMSAYDNLENYIESPKLRTAILSKHGLVLDGSRQQIEGMEIYPAEYFCPKSWKTGRTSITPNTYSIHYYEASWHGKSGKKYIVLMRMLNRIFGEKKGKEIFEEIIGLKDKIKGSL